MSEQRLIDANELIEQLESIIRDYTSNGVFPNGYDINSAIDSLSDAPTIGPETLPVVRELREELKNEIAKKEICGEIIERLDKQLKKITAERDAAVSDLRGMAIESYAECMYCLYRTAKSFCWNCNDGSNWTWRGPQKEE